MIKKLFLKYGWIVVLLTVMQLVLYYFSATGSLLHYLLFAPLSDFQKLYPHLWWLVFTAIKGGPLLMVASSVYFLATWWQTAGRNLRNRYSAQYAFLNGQQELNLWHQLIVSTLLFIAFSAAYFVLQFFISSKAVFFQTQLYLSYGLLVVLGGQFVLVVLRSRLTLVSFLHSLFTQNGSAYNLAMFRVVVGLQLMGIYYTNITANAYWAGFPDNMRVSLPYMGWFIQNVPISPAIYAAVCQLGIVLAWCIMLGLFTRVALLLNIGLGIYIIGVPFFYGKLFHMHIWVWFPLILAFSSCADVLSIDSLIKRFSKKPVDPAPHPKYQLPLTFVWLHLGIIYFFAGVIKLKDCGLAWALSDSMINQVQVEWAQWYNLIPAIRIDHYPWLLNIGGLVVILFEIYFPFLVLNAWGRMVAFAGGLAMHNLIGYFMYIAFEDLQSTYVALVNWPALFKPKSWFAKTTPAANDGFKWSTLWPTASYKWVFVTGITLLTINFIFGVFRIHSWPFSSYPTYSAIVPAERNWVYFDAYDKNCQPVSVYDAGKAAGFRMESYTPIEDRIVENVRDADTVTLHRNVNKLWSIWRANVPALQEVDSVAVYLRKSPVAPERVQVVLENKYLMNLDLKSL